MSPCPSCYVSLLNAEQFVLFQPVEQIRMVLKVKVSITFVTTRRIAISTAFCCGSGARPFPLQNQFGAVVTRRHSHTMGQIV